MLPHIQWTAGAVIEADARGLTTRKAQEHAVMIRLSDSQAWKLAAVAIVIAVMLPILIKFWVTTVQASVNIH